MARRQVSKLDDERTRLLQAHLADAVPIDVLRREQSRLTDAVENARRRIVSSQGQLEGKTELIKVAMAAAVSCATTYERAPADIRRLFNQAFFTRILIRSEEVSGAILTEPYAALLTDELIEKAQLGAIGSRPSPESDISKPGPVLSGPGSSNGNKGWTTGFEPSTAWTTTPTAWPN